MCANLNYSNLISTGAVIHHLEGGGKDVNIPFNFPDSTRLIHSVVHSGPASSHSSQIPV